MEQLATADVALVCADNPGPFTLAGTNTWLVGRDPCWIVDPGPALDPHLDRVAADAEARGGVAGIAITHDHGDHTAGVPGLLGRIGPVPVAAVEFGGCDVILSDGDVFGPLRAVATPGHASDHVAFLAGRVLFSGDAVLGHGSVYIAPQPGALRGYLAALERLMELELDAICPGHGPLVTDPQAKLREYRDHRLDRERRLVDALASGLDTADALLDRVWYDVPSVLRPAAAVTLAAHLDKLAEEDRLPDGLDRAAIARYGAEGPGAGAEA